MSPYQGTRPRRQNRKFIASLSPAAQVNKVIADENNLKGSYDLRTWSASARKEPTPSIYFILRVQVSEEEARSLNQNVKVPSTTTNNAQEIKTKFIQMRVPKLALIATSSAFRTIFANNPTANHLGPYKHISVPAARAPNHLAPQYLPRAHLPRTSPYLPHFKPRAHVASRSARHGPAPLCTSSTSRTPTSTPCTNRVAPLQRKRHLIVDNTCDGRRGRRGRQDC